MYKIGEYVVYGTSGVCEVKDITTMNLPDVAKDKYFYVLSPIKSKDGRIFTPVENQKTVMRYVISREDAKSLIDSVPQLEELTIPSEKQREDSYKTAFRSCDCREWAKMMKTLYTRKQKRTQSGRKIPSTDERYMRMVSDVLYSELSHSLEINAKEVEQCIHDRLEMGKK